VTTAGTEDTTLWSLRDPGGHDVQTVVTLTPRGLEVRLVWNGTKLYEFRFQTEAEVQAWAMEKRGELVAQGFMDVGRVDGDEETH
jgi:hypothetical protein